MAKWWNWLLAIAILALLLLAIPLTTSKNEKLMFDDYLKKFNKTYDDPAEYQLRFNHFKTSLDEIENLNAAARGPEGHRAKFGLTKLSDMSKLEYSQVHLSDEKLTKEPSEYGRSWRDHGHHQQVTEEKNYGNEVYKTQRRKRSPSALAVDWRVKGVVGPIKNQGLCGACWAFSTVGTIESMNAIKTAKFVPLSVQEAIDCATLGNSGCSGGDICLLLDWLVLTKTPLLTEKLYPLSLVEGTCKAKKKNETGVHISTFTCDSMVGSEDLLLESLEIHGPVTVAVNALTWQNYLGGVLQYHCSGTAADLNHAVEIVGYDLTGDVPYYIVKNSWGTDFGENGYLRLAVGDNVCGLANEVATIDVV